MSDLVERLRGDCGNGCECLLCDAADEIASLTARVEAVRERCRYHLEKHTSVYELLTARDILRALDGEP